MCLDSSVPSVSHPPLILNKGVLSENRVCILTLQQQLPPRVEGGLLVCLLDLSPPTNVTHPTPKTTPPSQKRLRDARKRGGPPGLDKSLDELNNKEPSTTEYEKDAYVGTGPSEAHTNSLEDRARAARLLPSQTGPFRS